MDPTEEGDPIPCGVHTAPNWTFFVTLTRKAASVSLCQTVCLSIGVKTFPRFLLLLSFLPNLSFCLLLFAAARGILIKIDGPRPLPHALS